MRARAQTCGSSRAAVAQGLQGCCLCNGGSRARPRTFAVAAAGRQVCGRRQQGKAAATDRLLGAAAVHCAVQGCCGSAHAAYDCVPKAGLHPSATGRRRASFVPCYTSKPGNARLTAAAPKKTQRPALDGSQEGTAINMHTVLLSSSTHAAAARSSSDGSVAMSQVGAQARSVPL